MAGRFVAAAAALCALLSIAVVVAPDSFTFSPARQPDTATPSEQQIAAPSEQEVLIPWPGERVWMRTTLLRPPGAGPFRLAVMNHGSSQNSAQRARLAMPDYPIVSHWLLDHGYAVALPLRPGHGLTGGPYFEDQGRCEDPDYLKSGLSTAAGIQAVIDDLTARPLIRKSGVVVVGQSAGGWGALALASRNPAMVSAVINFAGGRGGHADDRPNNNCAPDRLVEAAGEFGKSARTPSLWLYAENDSYFAPSLSERMYGKFRNFGGNAEFHLLPASGPEGHFMVYSGNAYPLWAPLADSFLTGQS